MYLNKYDSGRTAFVTGDSRGIGSCLAEALLEAGAGVVVSDIDASLLDDAKARLAGKNAPGVERPATSTARRCARPPTGGRRARPCLEIARQGALLGEAKGGGDRASNPRVNSSARGSGLAERPSIFGMRA
jgi:hypothetical protein